MEQVDPNAAPGRLEVVRELVNTLDVESGEDELEAPEQLRAWLVAHSLIEQERRSRLPSSTEPGSCVRHCAV
ncbi:MAG: ABATE domain-containing protein [Chloroflexota bacterium]|nr:ABATE domain-containing protein [Chloroflexota bacterium]